jgi:hypothetical protein
LTVSEQLVKEAAAGPATIQQAFTHPASHPLVLKLLLLKEMGPEYLGWLPETVWTEVGHTWGTTVSEVNKQKIQAVRACYVSDDVQEEWQAFEKVAAGLVGIVPRMYVMQRPTPGRALYTLEVVARIRDDKPGTEVGMYCAAVLMDGGMVYGPGALEIANPYILNRSEDLQGKLRAASKRPRSPAGEDQTFETQLLKVRAVMQFAQEREAELTEQMKRLAA